MPTIFSRPWGLHCNDIRHLREKLLEYETQITSLQIQDNQIFNYHHTRHVNFLLLQVQREEILRELCDCSTRELLSMLVSYGLLSRSRKIGKFLLKEKKSVSQLRDQVAICFTKLVTLPGKPGKSLFLGICVLAVLYFRYETQPMNFSRQEEMQLLHIKRMMEHSFFREDVIWFLREVHDTYLQITGPLFCQNLREFQDAFSFYFANIAWFQVMRQEILEPPPAPPIQISQPAII